MDGQMMMMDVLDVVMNGWMAWCGGDELVCLM